MICRCFSIKIRMDLYKTISILSEITHRKKERILVWAVTFHFYRNVQFDELDEEKNGDFPLISWHIKHNLRDEKSVFSFFFLQINFASVFDANTTKFKWLATLPARCVNCSMNDERQASGTHEAELKRTNRLCFSCSLVFLMPHRSQPHRLWSVHFTVCRLQHLFSVRALSS